MSVEKVVNIDYKPTKYQSDVHQCLKEYPRNSVHCIKAMRQIGKSRFIVMAMLKCALANDKQNVYAVSPTFNQASKLYTDLHDVIVSTPILRTVNKTTLTMTLYNKSVLRFFSAESGDNLRGYTCDFLAVDEAAYIDDSVFYSCLLQWTNVRKAPLILCSTPRFKQGFFYKYFIVGLTQKSHKNQKYFSYDWSTYDVSQFLDDEKKEEFRMTLPRQTYMSEVLGQWLDMEGSVFGCFDDCIQEKKVYKQLKDEYFMGIDWGTGNGGDDTAISIMNQNKQQMGIWHFNDKDETATIDFICDLIAEWKPMKCMVETNSIGNVFFGLLKKEAQRRQLNVLLIGFNTSNESKNRLVNNLQVAIQNKSISFVNDGTLVGQLSMYEGKPSKTGKMTYNAPVGFHDDTIIATMLSLECISKGAPSIFIL